MWNDNTNGKKVYTQYYMLDHIRFGSQRVNLGAVVVVRYDKGSLNGQKMNNRQKIDKKTRKKNDNAQSTPFSSWFEHRKDLSQLKTVKTKETGNVILGENRKEMQC